jgi:hypothetical protein
MAKKNKKNKDAATLGAMPPEMAAFAKLQAKAFAKGKEAAASESTFADYPDGYYMAALTDAEIGQSESSSRWQVKFEWTILDHDELEGKQMFNYQGINDEMACKYTNWFTTRLGEEPFGSMEDLRQVVASLIKRRPKCRLQLKTTKSKKDDNDYQNLRIKKVLEDLGVEARMPAPSAPDDKKKGKKDKKNKGNDDVVVVEETKKDKKKKKGKKGKK